MHKLDKLDSLKLRTSRETQCQQNGRHVTEWKKIFANIFKISDKKTVSKIYKELKLNNKKMNNLTF